MRFSLIFDGDLPASGTGSGKARTKEKQVIRRALDPQLRRVWKETPDLAYLRDHSVLSKNGRYIWTQPHPQHMDVEEMSSEKRTPYAPAEIDVCEPIPIGWGSFFPLVRRSLGTRCELKILFMRNEPPGRILTGDHGDLDNRLKTLFDGLAMPQENQLVKDDFADWPLYCLLESDSLISALDIRTEKLLTPTTDSTKEVRLVIDVNIRVTHARAFKFLFAGD
jgi:hypothetical protein